MAKNLIFDLDGTLTDSSEGILNCVLLALEHFGITQYEKKDLVPFIGPPIRVTFPDYGIAEENIEEAVKVFRGRYTTVGKFENRPYDGIKELLARLKADGHKLYVGTSKPEELSIQILEKFEMAEYFELICGATLNDASRDSKEAVLRYLLEKIGNDPNESIMIGDTRFDIIGAEAVGIRSVGVAWGFGDAQEMLDHGAFAVAKDMEELYRILG